MLTFSVTFTFAFTLGLTFDLTFALILCFAFSLAFSFAFKLAFEFVTFLADFVGFEAWAFLLLYHHHLYWHFLLVIIFAPTEAVHCDSDDRQENYEQWNDDHHNSIATLRTAVNFVQIKIKFRLELGSHIEKNTHWQMKMV